MSSKQREALKEADIILSVMGYDVSSPIRTQIKAALAEPLKNCEVGTPQEQSIIFDNFCNTCSTCPLKDKRANMRLVQCEFIWAQMPYEKEGE